MMLYFHKTYKRSVYFKIIISHRIAVHMSSEVHKHREGEFTLLDNWCLLSDECIHFIFQHSSVESVQFKFKRKQKDHFF